MEFKKDMRLPDVIVVGPQRTGTTWLYDNLVDHVGMPDGVKETLFFDKFYNKGIKWYSKHFINCLPNLPIIEIAPSYFHSQEAKERIKQHIPYCKIICTLRDPAERVYSLYRLLRIYGETNLSFEEAFELIPVMKDSSQYVNHLTAWQQNFGMDNTLVLFFDDLKENPKQYLRNITNFIGIDDIPFRDDLLQKPKEESLSRNRYLAFLGEQTGYFFRKLQMYKFLNFAKRMGMRKFIFEGGDYLPPLSQETEIKIRNYFKNEVERLEKYLHKDLSHWKSPSFFN